MFKTITYRYNQRHIMYVWPIIFLIALISSFKCMGVNRIFHVLFNQNFVNKGNNKITELRTILQRESQNA